MIEYIAIFMFNFLVIWWYFMRKYNNKVEDLFLRIEDLIIEKYRLRKDIVQLLEKITYYSDEISKKDTTIMELSEKNDDLQRQLRQKRSRTETD